MTKRNWTVTIAGQGSFQMVVLDRALTHAEALAEARSIWPSCTVS